MASQTTVIELQPVAVDSSPGGSRPSKVAPGVCQQPHEQPPPPRNSRVFGAVPPTRISPATGAIVTSLLVFANMVQFMSYFGTVTGGLALNRALGRGGAANKANWMAAAYPLTQSAFVLITGRLGAVYGHSRLTLIGCVIFALFSLVNGFCTRYEAFITARALTGVGSGLFMPNAVSTITITAPPGKTRNILLGFFAASPPIGGVVGALLVGVFTQYVQWKWFFITMAASQTVVIAGLLLWVPKEAPVDRKGHIDYVGAFLGLGSLLLFNAVWNQAPSVGWQTPYEIACLVVSVAMFFSFIAWEKYGSNDPIMPLSIFRGPTFSSLFFVVLLTYMAIGITMWYTVVWQQELRHISVLSTGVNFLPFGISSLIAVYLAAWLIPRVAAQWIMAVGVGMVLATSLLLATMPVKQTYWAQVFPAMIFSGFCPDFVFVAAQIIASNSVPRRHQGIASSLIGTLNLYGNSLGLGFASTIEAELVKGGSKPILGYRAALYFAAGLAVIGLLLDLVFVRVPKDEREGWDEPTDNIDNEPEGFTSAVDASRAERA